MKVTPYLTFAGNCAEAMTYYKVLFVASLACDDLCGYDGEARQRAWALRWHI